MPAMMPRTAPAEITLTSAAPAGAQSSIRTAVRAIRVIATLLRPQRVRRRDHRRLECSARGERAPGSGVAGLGREHADIDADLLQRLLVLALDVGPEDQLRIGRAMQPAVLVDFLLELAGRPAGIAERQERAARPLAARDRLEDVERRRETDALVDRQRGVLDVEVGRMQDEAALGVDRSALEHLHARRQLDLVGI